MATVQNWRRIRKRSVRRHAWRTFGGPRIEVCRKSQHLSMIDGNGRDVAVARSIRLRRPNIQAGICDRPTGRWRGHVEVVPDIVRVLNYFAAEKIIPGKKKKKLDSNIKNKVDEMKQIKMTEQSEEMKV